MTKTRFPVVPTFLSSSSLRGEIAEKMGSPAEILNSLILKLHQNKVKINRANDMINRYKDLMMQLQDVVNHTSEDSNGIEHQLRTYLQSMSPYSSLYPEILLFQPSGLNSGIAEPTYFPHISSSFDTFADCESFSGSSNTNNVFYTRKNNVGFINGHTWNQPGLLYQGMPESNPASVSFQNAVEEKGNLLSSVIDAGSLPVWHHPPPQGPQHINFAQPPRTSGDIDIDIDMEDMGNCADLRGDSFSDSMLNFTEFQSDPWIHGQVPGTKRQRLY